MSDRKMYKRDTARIYFSAVFYISEALLGSIQMPAVTERFIKWIVFKMNALSSEKALIESLDFHQPVKACARIVQSFCALSVEYTAECLRLPRNFSRYSQYTAGF
jgi:hypothetical protein